MTKVGDILVINRILKFYEVLSLRPAFTIRECKVESEQLVDGSANLKIVDGEFIGDAITPITTSLDTMAVDGLGELEHTLGAGRVYHYNARHVTSADYARKGELDPYAAEREELWRKRVVNK